MQLDITWQVAALTLLAAASGLTAVVAMTRINGLRSFAKMAPHDFAATIAIGSVLAATAAGSVPLVQGVVALAGLYATQRIFQLWRMHGGESVIDNAPLLLMAGPRVLWENMRVGGVTESDLRAKLREANVVRYEQVLAVVLEGTGDIAVLHAESEDGGLLDADILDGVTGLPEGAQRPARWRSGHGLRGANPVTATEEP